MERTKVRKYPTIEAYEEEIEQYFKDNTHQVIQYTVHELGYNSLEELQHASIQADWGLDCGWVYLVPRNDEMYQEWSKDTKKYNIGIFLDTLLPIRTQSTSIKSCEAKKLLEDKNWENIFYISATLD